MTITPDSPIKPGFPLELPCILRWPSETARHWAIGFAGAAMEDAHIDALIAIGSAVRPRAATSSDVDFVLIYHGVKPSFGTPPIDVDVRLFRRDEVNELISRGNDLLLWTVRYGCPVFDRDNFWFGIVERWGSRLPLPSRAISLERARKAQQRVSNLLGMGDEDAALEQFTAMLTHIARARLIEASVHPASRPELPEQLSAIGETRLAWLLAKALRGDRPASDLMEQYGSLD
jgi:hypothetical protein